MSDDVRGGDIRGALATSEGRGVVRLEARYDADPEDLWAAITDPDRLSRWYGRVEGDLREGGRFRLWVEQAQLDSAGTVETCEPPRHLVVSTRETDESAARGEGPAPFDQVVEASLRADGDQTVLLVEVRGLPLDRHAAYGAGWQIHLENLRALLAAQPLVDVPARWGVVLPGYEELASALS